MQQVILKPMILYDCYKFDDKRLLKVTWKPTELVCH